MSTIENWIQSGLPVVIKNSQLTPITKNKKIFSTSGEQGTVYRLIQKSTKKEWALKKFHAETLPTRQYLSKVRKLLPDNPSFVCGKKRMILTKDDLSKKSKHYYSESLSLWLNHCILMQKTPGDSWKDISCRIRDGKLKIAPEKRATIARNLSHLVSLLEEAECCHRDLSHENVFINVKTQEVYFTDWESVYHSSLKQKNNFTVGTPGYIAPWLFSKVKNKAQKGSWKKYSDRFSLGILIAEILLMQIDERPTKEGVLFSNEMFSEQENLYIAEKVQKMYEHSEYLGDLFLQCLTAKAFEECPTPQEWSDALNEIAPEEKVEQESKKIITLPTFQNAQESFVKWRKPVLALLVLLIILLLAIPFWDSMQNDEGSNANKTNNITLNNNKNVEKNKKNNLLISNNDIVDPPKKDADVIPKRIKNDSSQKNDVDKPVTTGEKTQNEIPRIEENQRVPEKKKETPKQEVFGLQEIDPQATQYAIKILYADNDLEIVVNGTKLAIDDKNKTSVSLRKGKYPVHIYFSSITFSENGQEQITGRASFRKIIHFGKDKDITIRINRLRKIWKVVR